MKQQEQTPGLPQHIKDRPSVMTVGGVDYVLKFNKELGGIDVLTFLEGKKLARKLEPAWMELLTLGNSENEDPDIDQKAYDAMVKAWEDFARFIFEGDFPPADKIARPLQGEAVTRFFYLASGTVMKSSGK